MKAQITTTYEIDSLADFIEYIEGCFATCYVFGRNAAPYEFDNILKGKRSKVDWVNLWDPEKGKEFQANTVVEILGSDED